MINHDLVREVIRLKDALIMFPQKEKTQKLLNIQSVVLPQDRPTSHMEWWLNIINGGQPSSITKYVKPAEKEEPKRTPLTQAQKNMLKALSYKPKQFVSFSVAA